MGGIISPYIFSTMIENDPKNGFSHACYIGNNFTKLISVSWSNYDICWYYRMHICCRCWKQISWI